MLSRIASIALTLVVLSGCERQDTDAPAGTSPAPNSAEQSTDRSGAGDRTRTQQTQPPGASTAGEPAEGGQHYDAGAARVDMHEQSGGMSEDERQAALRACERLEMAERERCEAEIRARSNPDSPPVERRE